MTDHNAEKDLIDASILFEREPCRCCDCCDGYCPDRESGESPWEALVALGAQGRRYVGTRYLVIRSDRLDGLPDDEEPMDVTAAKVADFTVPHAVPAVFTGHQSVNIYDRIDRAGLVPHGVEGDPLIHLYFKGEHVGWTRHSKEGTGVTLAELEPIRRLAKEAWLTLPHAEAAYRAALAVVTRPGTSS